MPSSWSTPRAISASPGTALTNAARSPTSQSASLLEIKFRTPKVEVLKTMLYGCVAWSANAADHYSKLRTKHRRLLLRRIGFRRIKNSYRMLSYEDALTATKCKRLEMSVRTGAPFRRVPVRVGDSPFPEPVVSGQVVGGANRGRKRHKTGRKACLDGNLAVFRLSSDWITPARNASAWHDIERARGETAIKTWRRKRLIVANTRHARREAKDSTAKAAAEEAKEEEALENSAAVAIFLSHLLQTKRCRRPHS